MDPRICWWRVDLGEPEASALVAALSARRVTMGPLCEELEARLASFLGVPHCVLVNSGTSALVVALLACGVGPGDEVVVPGITFIATANAARLIGARVRLVDVRPDRPLMDPEGLAAVVGPKTRVVIPVHIGGRAVDLKGVLAALGSRRVFVVEDAAQAMGSRDADGFLGTKGDLGCFSLGITKLVTIGEGGLVATRDPEMDINLRRIRNNGALSLGSGLFEGRGSNFRPLDLLAAVGLVRLQVVERTQERLRAVYRRYREGLEDLKSVRLIPVDVEGGEVPLWVEALASDRAALIRGLAEREIEAKPYPPALCDVESVGQPDPLPRARYFAAHGLILPSGPDRTDEELDRVLRALRDLDGWLGQPVPDPPGVASRLGRGSRPAPLDDPFAFRRDDSGRSLALFALAPVQVVDSSVLANLKKVARREGGVARICLHRSPQDTIQDMLIAKTTAAPVRPGRYLRWARTFHVLRGRLALLTFREDGSLLDAYVLGRKGPILRVEPGICYVDFSVTKYVIYREVLFGPHDPSEWVGAGWWPASELERTRLVLEWRRRVGG